MGESSGGIAGRVRHGAGANVSATATRESKMNFYFTVKELYETPPCKGVTDLKYRERSFLISDHLGLGDWLRDYILVVESGAGNAPTDNATPLSTGAITDHIRFEVVEGANVTPAWGLARVDINRGGTLFSASRDGVHDLLITYGPVDPNTGRLVGAATDQFLASQIGAAVDDATP